VNLLFSGEGWRERFPLLLAGFIAGFVPLIVYLRIETFQECFTELYSRKDAPNFFTVYKALWLCLVTYALAFWFVVNGRLRRCYVNFPLAVYFFLVLCSTVFSKHPLVCLTGAPDHHEGIFVVLAYVLILFLIPQIVSSEKQAEFILKFVLFGAICQAILGFLEVFFGFNILYDEFTREYLAAGIYNGVFSLQWLPKPSYGVPAFTTIGNGNFYGSYLSLLYPLTFVLGMFETKTRGWFFLYLNSLLFIGLLGSKSRAAFYASLISIFLVLVLGYLKKNLNTRKIAFYVLSSLFVFFLVNYREFGQGSDFFKSSIGRPMISEQQNFGNIVDLKLKGDSAHVEIDNVVFEILWDKNGEIKILVDGKVADYALQPMKRGALKELDSWEKLLKYLAEAADRKNAGLREGQKVSDQAYVVIVKNNLLKGCNIIAWPDFSLLRIDRTGAGVFLVHTDAGFKLLNHSLKPVDLKPIEKLDIPGFEQFASRRGYIWMRSIPLLKRVLLIGFGPDNFPLEFPNHDYLGKLKEWKTLQVAIEKPHNLYLQTAMNSGVLSLIIILWIIFKYIRDSIRLYFKITSPDVEVYGSGIFFSITGYLIVSFFNDSMVTVAPVFWVLLGLGVAVNRINQLRLDEAEGKFQAND